MILWTWFFVRFFSAEPVVSMSSFSGPFFMCFDARISLFDFISFSFGKNEKWTDKNLCLHKDATYFCLSVSLLFVVFVFQMSNK